MKSIFVLASLLVLSQALPQSVRFEGDQNKTPIKAEIDVDTRAPSDYNNCNCQCDSYSWVTSSGQRAGNCRVSDRTGARFCYVSGHSAAKWGLTWKSTFSKTFPISFGTKVVGPHCAGSAL